MTKLPKILKVVQRNARMTTGQWVLIILILGGGFLFFSGAVKLPTSSITTDNPPAAVGLVNVIKPIQFSCFDAFAGANCGAVTVALYQGASTVLLETLTASSSGVATTGNSYPTSTAMTIKVSGNSKVTEYLPFTVPGMDANSAISAANNVVAIYAVTLGTWTITVTGTGGTTITSGKTYITTGFTGSSAVITITISETASNAGYKSSHDITNPYTGTSSLFQGMGIQMDDGGTQNIALSGLPRSTVRGSTNYYWVTCNDGIKGNGISLTGAFKVVPNTQSAGTADSICSGSLSQQTLGNTNYGGTTAFSYTVAAGAGGGAETVSHKLYYYYDWGYFLINGNGGPNAAQSSTTFTMAWSK